MPPSRLHLISSLYILIRRQSLGVVYGAKVIIKVTNQRGGDGINVGEAMVAMANRGSCYKGKDEPHIDQHHRKILETTWR